jgi:hypothetical protein
MVDFETISVYAPASLDHLKPMIRNLHGIENDGLFYLPCASPPCSFHFVFDIYPMYVPPLAKGEWIIRNPGTLTIRYIDSEHVRFDILLQEMPADNLVQVGYRISNACYEKMTWFNFRVLFRPRSYSDVQIPEFESLEIWPNPVTDHTFLTIDRALFKQGTIDCYSESGTFLSSTDFNQTNTDLIRLDFRNYAAGIYYLVITSGSLRRSYKIVKL